MAFAGISQTKTGFDWKQEADPAFPFFMAGGIWAGRLQHPRAVLGLGLFLILAVPEPWDDGNIFARRDWDEMGFKSFPVQPIP